MRRESWLSLLQPGILRRLSEFESSYRQNDWRPRIDGREGAAGLYYSSIPMSLGHAQGLDSVSTGVTNKSAQQFTQSKVGSVFVPSLHYLSPSPFRPHRPWRDGQVLFAARPRERPFVRGN